MRCRVTNLGGSAAPYFQQLMPALLAIIKTPLASTDYVTLFCRAMECAGCMVAAGRSSEHLDAGRVLMTQILTGPVLTTLLQAEQLLDVAEELSYAPSSTYMYSFYRLRS